MSQPAPFRQISFFGSKDTGKPTAPADVPIAQRKPIHEKFQTHVIEWNDGEALNRNMNEIFVPMFVYTGSKQLDRLKAIYSALNKALIHLVENWWSDEEADYPKRMPMEKHLEELLRWIGNREESHMPPYSERRDVQRPDFLIEKIDGPNGPVERIKICEINGRWPYNGFHLVFMIQHAAAKVFPERLGMRWDLDEKTTLDKLIGFWNTSKPLHIIKDGDNNVDHYIFARKYREITGQPVTIIAPADVVLAPDSSSETGKALFYRKILSKEGSEEVDVQLERIYQCSIEPHQLEQSHYDLETHKYLARIGVNDMRTAFLTNDKRMLAILYEDIDSLTQKKVLTTEEAATLRDALIPTYLPGSAPLQEIVRQSRTDPQIKDKYIIKAVRGAGSRDIYYGTALTQEEWLAYVEPLTASADFVDGQTFILQDALDQLEYDIVRTRVSEELEKFCLVGTFHTISGQYAGMGPWRISGNQELLPLIGGRNIGMVSVIEEGK